MLGEGAVSAALEAVASPHWGVRKSGAFVLGELGIDGPAVRSALCGLTSSAERPDVRSTAAVALGRIAAVPVMATELFELVVQVSHGVTMLW